MTAAAPRPRPQPGSVIDGFLLEERVHEGSMATIWRVSRPDFPVPLAMKMPLTRDFDDPTAIVGFEVETMILPTLSGVHVPRFIAAGDLSVEPYIVMEFVAGPSLRARLADAPLNHEELASIGAKVASALHDLHSQHVIHLDLKPSNVMFRPTGEAVLIDFGLSRHDRLPDLLAEEFRVPMGTGPYISPEQVRHRRNDPRSDLFSLGVVLYFLATGERPFGNPTSIRGLRKRLYRDPVPPRARTPTVPPWIQEIILRCLEVDPRNRYESAAQLAFQLQHPEQVKLSWRADKMSADSFLTVARRRFRAVGEEPPEEGQSASDQLSRAPIILIALDLAQASPALTDALRLAARRVLHTESGARLACVTVMKQSRIGMDVNVDEEGRSLHLRRLVELKDWARPLGVPPERITYHVLEAPDAGDEIIEFARANHVDQIVIGSRGSSTLRRYLGSVSSQVVAESDCTVIVVKAPESAAARAAAAAEEEAARSLEAL
ncbi:MAG TPA: bifunctional serine/threonine-protein kinase/universal stress protein [Thermoanaerobaculia bacterium]|nr:bifunctional serine/threonine-protein kinase/universal stress protein [Thermoanaerobaculia bacterium]